MGWLLRFAFSCGVAVLLSGCTDLGYYWQAASGHFHLLSQKEDIETLIANPDTKTKTRRKLQLVLKVREFAVTALALPENPGYTGYTDLGRSYVTVVVTAAKSYALSSQRWCYWFVGCQEYRGYFEEPDALDLAKHLESENWDVAVSHVTAYSTLGWLNQLWLPDWFSDPVLNTFLNRRDEEIAATLIHEMAHQVVYVPDDTPFNESFAVFVEETGVASFLRSMEGDDSPKLARYHLAQTDRERFQSLVLATLTQLEKLYASGLPEDEMHVKKTEAFAALKTTYREQREQFRTLNYDRWFAKPLNNAHLLGVRRYETHVDQFRSLHQKLSGDWQKFYERIKEMEDWDRSRRQAFLKGISV